MFEVLVTLEKTDNRLKQFPTFAEARLWAENSVKPAFPDAKISIYYAPSGAPSELMETIP